MRGSFRCPCRKKNLGPILFIIVLIQLFVVPFIVQSNFSSSTNTIGFSTRETIGNLLDSNRSWKFLSIPTNLSQNVKWIPLNITSNSTEYECKPTKLLFDEIRTIDCVEKRSDHQDSVDIEIDDQNEQKLQRLFKFLNQNRQVHLIDIGTDASQDMLYASSLARFVLIVDHDRSSLFRLRHTIQMMNAVDRVVLLHNFIHQDAGQFYEIFSNSSQSEILTMISIKDEKRAEQKNVVKTIRFDALLPIIVSIGIREAMIKINLNANVNDILQTGESIFNSLTIPLIQIEWSSNDVRRKYVRSLIQLFHRRDYVPVNIQCHPLNLLSFKKWPNTIYWIKTNSSSGFC